VFELKVRKFIYFIRYSVVKVFVFWGWSGTKQTITEPTKWPTVQVPDDDDECGTIGEMLGRGTEVLEENLP
jgi:hypothetical protein